MSIAAEITGITLAEAMEFVWIEADLLDSAGYEEWLALWTPDGRYIVPIDPAETDFEATLNLAYDDAAIRRKRVERLTSGSSISASPVARTVRLLSRFRLLRSDADSCELRCAQILTEFRRERERIYTANIHFHLKRTPSGLKIDKKIVWLINSTAAPMGIGYIL